MMTADSTAPNSSPMPDGVPSGSMADLNLENLSLENLSLENLSLEDLSIGQEFSSGEYEVDAKQIIAFAQEFDPQPFHTDPEAARNTFFQGHAASGWHTAAITMRLLVQCMPLARGLLGINGLVSWPRPTRPGDRLHVRCKITAITPSRSKPDRAIVQLHSQTFNQAGEPVLDLETKIMVFKRQV